MTDFNIPAGTTQTISGLGANSTNTVEGNSTAAYGAGGGTLISTGPLPGQCSVTVTGGVFDVDGVSNNDTITLNNATLDITGGNWNSSTTINFGTGSSGVIVPAADATSPDLDGVQFTGLNNGDYILTGSTSPITNVSWSSDTLHFTQNGINYAVAATLAPGATASFSAATENGKPVIVDGSLGAVCFLLGTMIACPDGERAVETLSVGDLVLTYDGRARPVKWIGRGMVAVARGRRTAATPVVVRKSALADNVPHHDLRITKGHSLFIDGALIPVEFLVNHRSIVWDDWALEVEIYHVELETHGVIIANGAAAETYRDDGNRWLFQNANFGWHLLPQEPCAPVLTGGPIVDAIWQRLLERALPRPGFPVTDDADLHLLVDGRRVDPGERHGDRYWFHLETRRETVHIASRAASPNELGISHDPRVLGVAVRSIVVSASGRQHCIEAADPLLREGFHCYEPAKGIRWTNGDATIPARLFQGCQGGPIDIEVVTPITALYLDEGEPLAA